MKQTYRSLPRRMMGSGTLERRRQGRLGMWPAHERRIVVKKKPGCAGVCRLFPALGAIQTDVVKTEPFG